MSNTRYHSIMLKVKEKQESNPGRQSDDRMDNMQLHRDWTAIMIANQQPAEVWALL